MPRVYLNETDRICHRMFVWAQGEKKRCKVTNEHLGAIQGITGRAWRHKFEKERMSFGDFVILVREFRPDDDTLRYILGL